MLSNLKRNNSLLLFISILAFCLRLQGAEYGVHEQVLLLDSISHNTIYPLLRFFSILFGTCTVITIYFIGKRLSDFTALLASIFTAVSFLHIQTSQENLPISTMIFFVLLSTLFAIKVLEGNKNVLWVSISSAIIASLLNLFGIVAFLPVIFLSIKLKKYKDLKFGVSIFLLFFIIFNLQHLTSPLKFLHHLLSSYLEGYYFFKFSSAFLHLTTFIITAVGPLVYIGCILSYKLLIKNHKDLVKILLSILLLYIGLLTITHQTSYKYTALMIPYVSLFAAIFFDFLRENSVTITKRFVFLFLLILSVWIPLKYTFRYNKIIKLPDTKTIATEWVKENSGRDYKIAYDDNSIKFKVLKIKKKYEITDELLATKDWFKILRKKVDYIAINSLDYERAFKNPKEKLKRKYYKKLLKLPPKIVFNPYLKDLDEKTNKLLIEELYSPFLTLWQRERTGPVIKIYKI